MRPPPSAGVTIAPLTAVHLALAVAGSFFVWRAALRVAQAAPDEAVAAAFPLAIAITTVLGSVGAIAAGLSVWSPRRALALDAVALGACVWWLSVLAGSPVTIGLWTRELGGLSLVFIVVARLAPAALAVATMRAPAWLAFAVALGAYGALAAWLPAASLPLGDQVHYLLAAEDLRRGDLDATLDEGMFRALLGIPPGPDDIETHVASTPAGPRPIQGHAMPLLLLPGWILAGRLGAHLSMAVVAAWTSYQIFLILRDLGYRQVIARGAGWAWMLTSFLAPVSPLATHIYPNIVGAALIATAFRTGFTAPVARPAFAAALLAATLFLTPRDGVALLVLLPFLLAVRESRVRVIMAAGGVALAAILTNAVLYGLPVPYAGYAFGTGQAQALTGEPSITPRFWVGLPGILFDRTFGLAGTAPWVFIGLLGLVPLLRARDARRVVVPAALAVGASVVLLSFVRLWEGGYAPPNRYLVDVLPVWAPFVAAGLATATTLVMRAFVGITLLVSALATLILAAIPSTALNTAFDHQIRDGVGRILGLDPLGWLPAFQAITPDWYIAAYLRLVPALGIAAALVLAGARHDPGPAARPRALDERSFLAANALGMALVVIAGWQPWIAAGADPVPESLLRKWVPLALALAAASAIAIARLIPTAERQAFLARHLGIYLVPLGLMVMAYSGLAAISNSQLGAAYLAIALVFAANSLLALWRVVGAEGEADVEAGLTQRPSDRAVALHLALVALVAFLVLMPYVRAFMPTASDEPHYLIIMQSLALDGDLDLRNDYDGDRYRAFYPDSLPQPHAINIGEALYSVRDLGLPLASAVPFALGGRLGVLALVCLVGAALVFQLFLLLRDLAFSRRIAFLSVTTTALVHPILTYTTQIYPELMTALVFVSVARVLRSGARATHRELALASALLGLLPWLSTRAWPIAVGAGLVLAYAALRPLGDARSARSAAAAAATRIAAALLPFSALVLMLCAANWLMFGLFMPAAGYFWIRDQQQVLAYTAHIGLSGLLFDRAFGLIPRAPVYLLGFLGIATIVRRARAGHGAEIAVLGLGGLSGIAYIANIAYWHAEGSPPSRYLLGTIPLFVLLVSGGWEVLRAGHTVMRTRLGALPSAYRRGIMWAAGLAVSASAAVAYVYAVQPNIRYDLAQEVRDTGSSGRLFGFIDAVAGLDPGVLFPSVVRADPAAVALAIPYIAAAGALIWLGTRAPRDERYELRAVAQRARASAP